MNIYYEYIKSFHRLLGTMDFDLLKRRKQFFKEHDNIDFFQIPIFIISYNRLSYLIGIIGRLEEMGYKNIKIIDNASTYPPLLDFYDQTSYEVFRMKENLGHMVFWKSDIFDSYRKDLYVVTDPDILPVEDCPADFMKAFYNLLKKYPRIKKAGFSLKIDDIPKNALLYDAVNKWERNYQFFKIPWEKACSSDIDTTFALYLPDSLDISRRFLVAIRTQCPIEARHLPWYKTLDDNNTDEDKFYNEHKTNGFWDTQNGKISSEGDISKWLKESKE